MGQVYLGVSAGGRLVAVKVIRAELAADAEFRSRFRREVSAARRVSEVFTAAVVDADTEGAIPWLATAYVAGPSLAQAVALHGPMPVGSVLALAAGLAESLAAIHSAGVVHRDLKPSNVLLAADGPRVIDFGISRATDATNPTRAGFVVGSPGFMSPEQAEGRYVGPPSDIFGLGGTLAFAASGRGPFGAGATAALVYRVVHSPPDLDLLPAEVRSLARRCLAKDPAARPTARELLAEVGSLEPVHGWLPEPIIKAVTREQAQAEAGTEPEPAVPGPLLVPDVSTSPSRLWRDRRGARRRLARRRRLVLLGVLLMAGVVAAAGGAVVALRGPVSARALPASDSSSVSPEATAHDAAELQAASLAREQAAGWIAQQVSPSAIVACDPAMCSELETYGVPASRLLELQTTSADPLGADIVVATAALRSQFGARLGSVYAPLMIASFGAGTARIQVCVVAPDGAATFEASLTADHRARITAGELLLRNRRITVAAAARGPLTAGSVDPRLLNVLAALAGQQQIHVVAFDDASPGAGNAPLRGAEIGAANAAGARSMLSFLRAQQQPYLAARIGSDSGGRYLIEIQFDAPSPMGLTIGP